MPESVATSLPAYAPTLRKAHRQALRSFERQMNHLKQWHACVLGIWAALNIVVGGLYAFPLEGEWAYVHEMNLIWGCLNAGIALFVFWHHHREMALPMTLLRQMDIQRHAETVILFNVGLDVAYVAGGLVLRQHGQVPDVFCPELWKGFGSSVLLQGTVLLLLDTVFYRLHVHNRKKIHPIWKTLMEMYAFDADTLRHP